MKEKPVYNPRKETYEEFLKRAKVDAETQKSFEDTTKRFDKALKNLADK